MDLDDELSISLEGSRYTDPEDTKLRSLALKLSCDRNKFFGHDLTPQDILHVADTFFDFLKGETK